MSRVESALLSMPTELFSALSPMGGKGEMLSVDNLLDALEDVSGCEEVLVVDKPGDLSLKTLYMPRGRCSVLIMPGWNVPASYPPTEPLTCGDGSGSGSGSGPDGDRPFGAAGRRRLLAKQATRSQRSGTKSTRSKAAGQGLHRVLAKHHQHHMLSSPLPPSIHKTSTTKKRQLVNLQKREISSKQARARRRSHVHEELRKLKGSRPAARVRAMVRSRRTSVERALAKSTEQSAVRVVKRGSRSLLDKHGMRAYRSAMGKMRQIIKSLGHRLEAVVKNVPRDATSNLRKVSRNDARNKKANTRTYHEPEGPTVTPMTYAQYTQLFETSPEIFQEMLDGIREGFDDMADQMERLGQPIIRYQTSCMHVLETRIHPSSTVLLSASCLGTDVWCRSFDEFLDITLEHSNMPSALGSLFLAAIAPSSGLEARSTQEVGFMARILNGCTLTRLAMNYSVEGTNDGSGSGNGSGDGMGNNDQLPYCGQPWTVGQRVVKQMDTDGGYLPLT